MHHLLFFTTIEHQTLQIHIARSVCAESQMSVCNIFSLSKETVKRNISFAYCFYAVYTRAANYNTQPHSAKHSQKWYRNEEFLYENRERATLYSVRLNRLWSNVAYLSRSKPSIHLFDSFQLTVTDVDVCYTFKEVRWCEFDLPMCVHLCIFVPVETKKEINLIVYAYTRGIALVILCRVVYELVLINCISLIMAIAHNIQ